MRTSYQCFLGLTLLAGFLITSCAKDDQAAPPANPSFRGDFVSAAHQTKGIATIDQEKTTLTLTNFKTDSGPDLNIYLTSSLSAITSDFIDLGDIKGVKGNYTYDLPDNLDYAQYKFVIVWCVDFDVNFGYAELAVQ
ncbi:MAG TPA: DM13 domain-containing protein [Saprospiraceae bacterium]|nr:DM13 domain-containing protein [Saprospiraceae bacterium]